MTWLCWTAVSHLIVFCLVHHPEQTLYLVMSDVVQVDDTRELLPNPVDGRIGEHWMSCVVGCSLDGIAAQSQGKFHFHVNDATRDPAPTPADDFSHLSDSTILVGETSSGSNWTPQFMGQRIDV